MKQSIVAIAVAIAMTGTAPAQNWPARPITMVVAFPAGGSDDILARVLAPRLSELLGQPVMIENMSGAGGMTGAARVAKAAPDGYQLMLGTSATHALSQALHKNPPYNSVTDFTPVALVAEQPFVLIARKDLPANGLQEFAAYAKANETRMQYGSAGAGSATHLVCALLNAAAGIKVRHTPYNGGAPALQDLIAGRIDYFCPVVTIAISQIENRSVKAIAILTKDHAPVLPNLASAHEQGLSDFAANTWFGIFLPKDTPAPIVQKLHGAVVAAMGTPAVQVRLKEIGATMVAPDRRSPDYLQGFLASDIAKWTAAIKAADIKVE
jgi:tripartite-type tricarboxylate transporter receptor subunit TctC